MLSARLHLHANTILLLILFLCDRRASRNTVLIKVALRGKEVLLFLPLFCLKYPVHYSMQRVLQQVDKRDSVMMHALSLLTILMASSNGDRTVHASLIMAHWCGGKKQAPLICCHIGTDTH